MFSPFGLIVQEPKSSVKHWKRWTTKTSDFFVAVKTCVESVTLLGYVYKRIMVRQYASNSPEQHSSDFEFRMFLSPRRVGLSRQESLLCSIFYP